MRITTKLTLTPSAKPPGLYLAGNLRTLRIAHDMAIAQLAGEIGISPHTCYSYEASLSKPSLDKLVRMARYYSVSMDLLLERLLTTKEAARSEINRQAGRLPVQLSIPVRLQALRHFHGISLPIAAAYAGFTPACYRNFETGLTLPGLSRAIRLAHLYTVPFSFLIGADEHTTSVDEILPLLIGDE